MFKLAANFEGDTVEGAAEVPGPLERRRRQRAVPSLACSCDVEIAKRLASECQAGDLRDWKSDTSLDTAVRVISNDFRSKPMGAPDVTFCVNGDTVRHSLVAGYS